MARKKAYTDALNKIVSFDKSRNQAASRPLNSNSPNSVTNAATFNAVRSRRVNNSSRPQSNLLSEKELLHEKFYDTEGNLNTTIKNIYGTDATKPILCIFDLTPTFTGMASITPKVGPTAGGPTLVGDGIFNIYQAIGTTNSFSNSPALQGGIEFETIPCVKELQIRVVGRADTYGTGYDTLTIKVDNVQKAFFQSTNDDPFVYPLSKTVSYDSIVTLTFDDDDSHTVNISGISGTIANNNVGYDIKITHTI